MELEHVLTRSSRLYALAGLASLLFGFALIVWPNIGAGVLLALFGAFALGSGVFLTVAGIDLGIEHARHWLPIVFAGLFGIAIGAYTFFRPGITALALLYLIALWAILTGLVEFVVGITFTGQVPGVWALWLSGLVSVAFGVLVAVRPRTGALAIIWLIGLYAIMAGILRMAFAFQLNQERGRFKLPIRKAGPA
jgi:uncharacterized membrane protein HdeD (DUF308 family)